MNTDEKIARELKRLSDELIACADYHQGYAIKLETTDPERSRRQQKRADYLRSKAVIDILGDT